jgi:GNAT superfamily N-acetyltransferase
MKIESVREKDLTPQQAAELVAIQHAAFPGTPEFVTQRWYHTPLAPDEMWFFGRKDGRMVCSVRVIHRTISIGAARFRVAGIANVGSHPDVRGTGAGKACMQAVGEYIAHSKELDFGLLFTGAPIDGFYAKLGWKTVTNQHASIDDKGERVLSDPKGACVRMIYPGLRTLDQWPDGLMDLNGRDW